MSDLVFGLHVLELQMRLQTSWINFAVSRRARKHVL
jgi:hypothetical protein